jgi:methylglutaconyl-CoA hydratase
VLFPVPMPGRPGAAGTVAAGARRRSYTAVVGSDSEDARPLVRVERRGPVVVVTLDSPHNRNALSARLMNELSVGLHEARADPDVRAVVLTGTGTVFCSGADLQERLHPGTAPAAVTLPEILTAIASLPQPVVARVNGHVRAGGMGLVAACDLAVAPLEATFAFTEVRVGVAPAIIAVPAVRRMGRRAFDRFTLTGDVFGAPAAAESGLLTASVPDVAGLDAWVEAALASVLRSSPQAVAATKGLAPLADASWEDAMSAAETLSDQLFASAAAAEGMAAFLEKREPTWVVEWPSEGAEGAAVG